MSRLYLLSLRWKLHRLERHIDRPFDPDISRQIDCLQSLLDAFERERRGK